MTHDLAVTLTNDEALVLFDWLSARADALGRNVSNNASLSAEEIVLAGVLCQLAKVLSEPFDPAYRELLVAARTRVQNPS